MIIGCLSLMFPKIVVMQQSSWLSYHYAHTSLARVIHIFTTANYNMFKTLQFSKSTMYLDGRKSGKKAEK